LTQSGCAFAANIITNEVLFVGGSQAKKDDNNKKMLRDVEELRDKVEKL